LGRFHAELRAIHPLGKSPVLTDGDLTLAESGAIVHARPAYQKALERGGEYSLLT
jgi:hypothetical protein